MQFVQQGHSVIVSAPTGAGKTVIAEHVIEECIRRGEKVIYTAPIKALSNQKYRDFETLFPGKIGILTGDVTINPQASTLIMTTEIFRNRIIEEKSSLYDYAWVIFDEIHYIDDFERGSVWEESLMFLPDHMNVLGLSATIPNIDELAGWFKSIHKRPLKVVTEHQRPVPLHIFFQCQDKFYDKFQRLVRQGFKSSDMPYIRERRIPRQAFVRPNRMTTLTKHLLEEDFLPCIYFVFSRRRTEYLAEEVSSYDFLNAQEKKEIGSLFDELCRRFDVIGEPSAYKIKPFIERGIAYHHAGMLPTLKEVIERLFTSRLIKMIFTTETFALGINMPARTVVFDELRKFYGRSHANLKTRDFFQMAGRAGRRSIDTEGFVFCRINPHYMSPRDLRKIVHSQPEPVYSRFNATYATVLHLYQKYGEKLYDIYPLSFHYYLENKKFRKKALEMLRAKVQLLKDLGHIRKNKITHKGLFASQVYGYELVLAELYDSGKLEELSMHQLGMLAASLVYEPRKGASKPPLKKPALSLENFADKIVSSINKREKRMRIKPLSKKCYFHLSNAVDAWIKGESFDKMLRLTDVDEGEIVRNLRMCIQILRDIAEAPISEALQGKAWRLIDLINRDIIDSEKQLRS